MKIIRWKALLPLSLLLVLMAVGWVLFIDRAIRRAVEVVGTDIVGAKVELAGAHVRLGSGSVVLTGLQVTDPGAPMENLVEAGELVAAVSLLPVLEKKMVIDSLAVRGVLFGTPRKTSGAIPAAKSAIAPVVQRVSDWARQIPLPSFSLEGLGTIIRVPDLSVDSLRTLKAARAITAGTDSARQAWESQARGFNPQPQVDSAQALLSRLKGVDVRTLGVAGVRDQLVEAKAAVDNLNRAITQAKTIEQNIHAGVGGLEAQVTGLAQARAMDYSYARGLVKLPSLDAPDISPALFGQMALDRIKGVLYWVALAEQYLPPGLDPRRQQGPSRMRASGSTVEFPRAHSYPQFLLRYADVSFTLGGGNAAAGEYQARLAGITTQPALYGKPAQAVAQRKGGRVGPEGVRAMAVLDHTRLPLKDSIGAQLSGLPLPTVALPSLGARAVLGRGTSNLSLLRVGDVLEASWYVRTAQPVWEKLGKGEEGRGKGGFGQDLLWRTVSGIREVEVETQIRGSLAHPAMSVRSNVGSEIARALKQEVGAQVEKAERQVRAKVDSAVEGQVAQARAKVDAAKTQVQGKIEAQRAELERVKGELEQKIKNDLTPRLPGGIRLPGGDE